MADENNSVQAVYDPNDGNKGEFLRWVTFQLDREIYGVNVMQVREVLRLILECALVYLLQRLLKIPAL